MFNPALRSQTGEWQDVYIGAVAYGYLLLIFPLCLRINNGRPPPVTGHSYLVSFLVIDLLHSNSTLAAANVYIFEQFSFE
jgi:hypothetical protein